MNLDYYYFNYQCPINYDTIMMLKKYEQQLSVNYYDISKNHQWAVDNSIYFPFLTVFNNQIRWRGPLTEDIIGKLIEGRDIVEKPYLVTLGKQKFYGELVALTKHNTHLLARGCTMNNCNISCNRKCDFLTKTNEDIFGYLHLDSGKVVGGIEYLPSLQVPYDIPKDNTTAFITCIYHSSDKFDYKEYPLKYLEEKLKGRYSRMIVISDEVGIFPNGNLEWFLEQGYRDEGLISIEQGYCRLHLMSKDI